ncbi:MAG TPA: hypothetical protein VMU83_00295 [Hanamia sp.]|nr:hypothetical protein [Hanamia sp.]
MKKKQLYNPLQFSLFDTDIPNQKEEPKEEKGLDENWKGVIDFLKTDDKNSKNQNNETDIQKSNIGGRKDVHDADGRRFPDESRLSHTGRMIYDMIKEQQPERFKELKEEKKLIPMIERVTSKYNSRMKEYAGQGVTEIEATELEWPILIQEAGLT